MAKNKKPKKYMDVGPLGAMERRIDFKPIRYYYVTDPPAKITVKNIRRFYLFAYRLNVICPKCKMDKGRSDMVTVDGLEAMRDPHWWDKLQAELKRHEKMHQREEWKLRKRLARDGIYKDKDVTAADQKTVDETYKLNKLRTNDRKR